MYRHRRTRPGSSDTRLGTVQREIERADTMPDGWQHWLAWHEFVAPGNETEIAALKADRGRFLGYARVVARRRVQAALADHIESVPAQYTRMPLLRSEEP